MSTQEQQYQQQQANRGILPSETLNALDYLVDRLNASSGRLPPATPATTATIMQRKAGDAASPPSTTTNNTTGSDNESPLPIRALLVGTNEGVGLSRSLGTAHTASHMQSFNDPSFSHSGSMSEEVLSSIETVWATLVSAAPPHVMAASAAAAGGNGESKNEEKEEDAGPPHIQPPHPLLSPLQMGDHIRTATATYDNCTLMHVHMAPLVVTFVTLPEANIGAIRSMALPLLKVLLEPVRRALVRSRGGGAAALGGEGNNGVAAPGQMSAPGDPTMEQHQQQAQQQGMPFMQQPQQQQGQLAQLQTDMYSGQNAMDPVLQQQLYQQQLYQQQQMMLAQQQFQR